ncbi:MAG: protein tyrosine phosphatase [Lachnospiraceae bacterium]|nr:protein tyrosine phosphatase [Lachnospiraceae bacterium]
MIKYNTIIFVSNSDTCRGQFAVAVMKAIGENFLKAKDIKVKSRGVVVLFPEPMNPKAVAIATSKNLHIEDHMSRKIEESDFGMDVLILTMSESIKKKLYDDYKEAVNVFNIKEFVGEDGDLDTAYGGELSEYGELFRDIERLINKVLDKLDEQAESADTDN